MIGYLFRIAVSYPGSVPRGVPFVAIQDCGLGLSGVLLAWGLDLESHYFSITGFEKAELMMICDSFRFV